MNRFFLTGDTHARFNRIYDFCNKFDTDKEDVMCILGDAGINFYLDKRDYKNKLFIKDLPITLFCIYGNHEERPYNISTYKIKKWNDGEVYYEEEFPNILFAKDGEVYNINGKKCLVIGGAYSVDKEYRLLRGWSWFKDELPTQEIMDEIFEKIKGKDFDLVLTHTCPISTEPRHLFLNFIDQSKVNKTMENFLQKVSENIKFTNWYFGHFHANWDNGSYHMLFEGYVEVE